MVCLKACPFRICVTEAIIVMPHFMIYTSTAPSTRSLKTVSKMLDTAKYQTMKLSHSSANRDTDSDVWFLRHNSYTRKLARYFLERIFLPLEESPYILRG